MNRTRWPIAVVLLIIFSVARPAVAAKALTVEQMEELVLTLHGKTDGKVSDELDGVQLAERASAATLARWEAELPGSRTHEALIKLADMSAFQDPPPSDLVPAARPDVKTQLSILSMAVHYVANTMPRLPDFYATRMTTHFENNLSQPSVSISGNSGDMLASGKYTRTVTYRDGKEVLYENASKLKQEPALSLTTSGEFGPILIVIVGDALHGSVQWLRWEEGAGGPTAVFSYTVPQAESHFMVGLAGGSEAPGILPAYHGEIAVDPATGAILRLSQIADMTPPHQQIKAEIAVDYGPVTISGRNYICPVRGVAFSQYPLISVPSFSTSSNTRGVSMYATGDKSLRPIKAELNDIAFTNYHEFGSEARIVANPAGSDGGTASGANDATAQELPAAPAGPVSNPPATASQPALTGPATEEAANAPSNGSDAVNPAAPATNAAVDSASTPSAAPAPNTNTALGTEAAENGTPPLHVSMPANASAAPAVFHEQSKLVLVDVVVTDHGKPVKGLDRGRFHVFEDGHEQNIASFEESVPNNNPAVVRAPALPPDTFTNVPAYPQTSAVNVLLLDGLNTEAADQIYVRREMIRFLKTLPAGQDIAIFTLGAKLRLIQGFTSDTAKLLAILAEKKSAAPASLRQSAEQKTQDQAELDQMTDAEVSPQDIANIQDFFNEAEMQQTSMRIDMTLDALQELARYLSGIPGRKNVVWFSSSFPLQFFAVGSDSIKQIAMNAGLAVNDEIRDTADLLAAERIALYPVDARGVMGQSMFDPTVQANDYTRPGASRNPIGGGTGRFSQDTQLAALSTDTEHSSMDVLAQETGGRAVYDSNGLKEALADALSDGSNFYSLAYVPPERKPGQTGVIAHSIEVKVDGARYQLSFRRGYYADDPNKPAESAGKMPDAITQAAVFGAPPSTQIVFQARALPEAPPEPKSAAPDNSVAGEKSSSFPEGTRRCDVDLSVPLGNLSIAEAGDGVGLAQLESLLVAYGEDGQLVNSVGRAFNFNLPAEQYRKLMASGGAISAHLAIDLPVRDVVLRIVVYDPASAKAGSIEIPVEVAGKPARSQAKAQAQ